MERWCQQLADELRPGHVKVSFLEQPGRLWRRLPLVTEVQETGGRQRPTVTTTATPTGCSTSTAAPAATPGRRRSAGACSIPRAEVEEVFSDTIGVATNNVAEYQALIAGLELALDRRVAQAHGVLRQRARLPAAHRALQGEGRRTCAATTPRRVPSSSSSRRSGSSACAARRTPEADRLVNEALDRAAR